MASLVFLPKENDLETIRFGTVGKAVTINVTFIPADIGYAIKKKMSNRDDNGFYAPITLAEIIAMLTDEVDAEWIAQNLDYGTMDQIAAKIIHRAFGRRAEKND